MGVGLFDEKGAGPCGRRPAPYRGRQGVQVRCEGGVTRLDPAPEDLKALLRAGERLAEPVGSDEQIGKRQAVLGLIQGGAVCVAHILKSLCHGARARTAKAADDEDMRSWQRCVCHGAWPAVAMDADRR